VTEPGENFYSQMAIEENLSQTGQGIESIYLGYDAA